VEGEFRASLADLVLISFHEEANSYPFLPLPDRRRMSARRWSNAFNTAREILIRSHEKRLIGRITPKKEFSKSQSDQVPALNDQQLVAELSIEVRCWMG
jgi:hypothetical protein